MDGIFGVGLAEMVIIGLVLFIVGGPKNSAKWAREMGRWVRKARQAWAQILSEMEAELGPEGKELMDATRELSKGAREVQAMRPTKRLMNETMRMVESAVDLEADTAAEPASSSATDTTEPISGNGKYQAWQPPDKT
jgi:Sec-independent protein translocase protein TatA